MIVYMSHILLFLAYSSYMHTGLCTICVCYASVYKCIQLTFSTENISFIFIYFYKMLHNYFHQFLNNLCYASKSQEIFKCLDLEK